MLPRFGDPDICPSVRFRDPELPSLHRVPRVGSPASAVLRSSLTSHHPSGWARLPSPGRTACAPARFALAACGRPLAASLVFGQPEPHRRSSSAEMAGSPRFLGEPPWPYAALSDPGRASRARPLRRRSTAAPCHYRDSPDDTYLSRLHHAAFGLAVYASQAPLRDQPTQDSLPAGGQPLPGRTEPAGSPPRGFRFVEQCLHRFLLSQACPGAQRLAPMRFRSSLRTRMPISVVMFEATESCFWSTPGKVI
jgi:hypothetical protein